MRLLLVFVSLLNLAANFPPGVTVRKAMFCRLALSNRNDAMQVRSLTNVAVLNEGTPPHPHELRAANRLAPILQERDQKLLVVTTINDRSIPALDGVVLDNSNYPVANVSLKSASWGTNLKRLIDSTIDQVVYYTVPTHWIDVTNTFSGGETTPRTNRQTVRLQNAYDWVTRAYGMFGIGLMRQTTIFIDFEGSVGLSLQPEHHELIQKRMNLKRYYSGTREPIVSEVILYGRDGIYSIKLP